MIVLLLSLFWFQPPQPVMVRLYVNGGTGSGTYECGKPIKIEAPKKHLTVGMNNDGKEFKSDIVFAQWHSAKLGDVSIDPVTNRKATVVVACMPGLDAVEVVAHYQAKPR